MTATLTRPSASPTGPAAVGHPNRRSILAVLCLALLITTIDNTILNTALPTLARVLHAGTTGLQWITDSYILVFASLLVTAGALGDRFGRRAALVGGLVIFALGSSGAALSGSTGTLIGWRVVMGIGAAFVMPATLSILTSVFPATERPGAIAVWSAVAGVGIVVGPTLGGFLLAHFAWGAVFWINVPLVVLAVVAALALVPGGREQRVAGGRRRLDPVGAALSIAGLVALVDAVIEAPDRGWLSALTVGEALAAGGFLAAFIVWELRSSHPMIDVRIFTHRAFSVAAGSITLIFFTLMGSLFALTQYLQLVHGYTALGAGIRALPFAGAMLVVSPLSSLLTARYGLRVVLPAGLLAMAAGLLALGQAGPHTAYLDLAGAVTIMGVGMALVMAPASESIMTVLPPDQVGAGSAVNDTIREVGSALGVAVIGSLVSGAYRSHLHLGASVPAAISRVTHGSIAAADAVGSHVGGPVGERIVVGAGQAYTSAMDLGFEVAAAVAVLGAVVVIAALPRRVRAFEAPVQASVQGPGRS